MTQRKIDDLFFSAATPSSSTRSGKRSRINQTITTNRDEFDDLFETSSPTKRRRTNQSTDVFDFDQPSTSTNIIKKSQNNQLTGSLKKKRSVIEVDDEKSTAIDELFSNDTRKKIRRPIKTDESDDLLDMFKTKTNTTIPSIISSIDDFKTPISTKNSTTQKKIKMFFDDSDLISLRDQGNEQNEIKDYVQIKPVLVTGGQWLSKEAENKSTSKTNDSSDNSTDNIPDDQRNLMHIQYVSLIADDETDNCKKSKKPKGNSLTRNSSKKILDGKSFHKQLVLSDANILRKENLQSCYNALLEDINKPRLPTATSLSTKQKKSSTIPKDDDDDDEEEQTNNIDFFDLPSRKKKF